ncbi:MAG: hypothetical protein A2041_13545 [Bacteroidetes bacterium GWA2_31_9b]|nr:MAG: hypothetical protein A2041_13545 [Bacteroidetes bacterium GWA2_31_9b]
MESNQTLLSNLFKRKFIKTLLFGVIISAIVVYLCTSPLFIAPQYKSEAIIYAPVTLTTQFNNQLGIGFGNNVEIDAYIQILKSSRLLDSLDNRFNLTKNSKLNSNSNRSKSIYYSMMTKKIKIEKTRYGSISISVKDQNSETAAIMANTIVELSDVIKESIFQENRQLSYKYAMDLLDAKQEEINQLEKKILLLIKTQSNGTNNVPSELSRDKLLYGAEIQVLAELRNKYFTIKNSLETPLPKAYIITDAKPSHSPYWPPRLLIVFATIITYLVIAIFIQALLVDPK